MAQIETPAPAERIAVLEINDEPGRASMMDWAFFSGASAGTLDAWRFDMRVVAIGGRLRAGTIGRTRAAPLGSQS